MLSQENVNTRLNRLERQTTQLKLCVFLLLGYVLFSSGVNDTIAELMSAEPPSSLTAPRESKEPREQARPAVPSSSISKPALTKQANVSNLVQTRRLQLIDNNGTAVLDFYASSNGGGVMNVHNGSGERTMRAHGMVRVEDGLWVTHTGDRVIVKLDIETSEEMDRIEIPEPHPEPHGLSAYKDGSWVYCDATSGWVAEIVLS